MRFTKHKNYSVKVRWLTKQCLLNFYQLQIIRDGTIRTLHGNNETKTLSENTCAFKKRNFVVVAFYKAHFIIAQKLQRKS